MMQHDDEPRAEAGPSEEDIYELGNRVDAQVRAATRGRSSEETEAWIADGMPDVASYRSPDFDAWMAALGQEGARRGVPDWAAEMLTWAGAGYWYVDFKNGITPAAAFDAATFDDHFNVIDATAHPSHHMNPPYRAEDMGRFRFTCMHCEATDGNAAALAPCAWAVDSDG